LEPTRINDLNSYLHFRKVQNKEKQDLIERDEAITKFNFLDCIKDDQVKNSWALQVDTTQTTVNYIK